jgi:hypothetical protein
MCRSLTSLQQLYISWNPKVMQLRTVDKFATKKCSKFKPLLFFDSGRSGSIIHLLLTIWKKLQTSNPSYGEGRGGAGFKKLIIHFLLILMTGL